MSWNKLSMADRAKYIKLAVENGISDLSTIRDTYNSFAGGGPKNQPHLEEALKEEYKELYDQYPARVVQDSDYDPWDNGGDAIETFIPRDNNPEYDRIIYPNGYRYDNPYPGENTIVYNNIRSPQQAVLLDYLHVLRHNDPEYKKLVDNLKSNASGSEIEEEAKYFYEKDKGEFGIDNMDSYDTYIDNATDGWLRSMFHTGTYKERKEDRYNPNRSEMIKNNPTLYEPTREIYNYLHPYTLPEIVVTAK